MEEVDVEEIEVDTKETTIRMKIVVTDRTTTTRGKIDKMAMRRGSINPKTKNIVTRKVATITTRRKSHSRMEHMKLMETKVMVTLIFKNMNTKRKSKHCKKNQRRILKCRLNQKDYSPKLNNQLYKLRRKSKTDSPE